jgi:nickel-dependent lactate racemase
VDWADLVISEGLIEPHFFAGFSGGRKSIMPGIAGQNTVLANHNSRFIADVNANTGILNNNPIHRDMLFAAKAARLRFILNVCINSEKEIVQAFAGHPEKAHYEGCEFVKNLLKVRRKESDIVITSNGGYPLDQNIYQAVKGMTAAETCVRKDGVIIMVAGCCDGHGGEAFYNWMTRGKSPEEIMQKILAVPPEQTMADQWQAQILARVLLKARVIMVTDLANKEMVESMHMSYACSLDEAIKQAEAIVGSDSSITVIPDGVGVIVE